MSDTPSTMPKVLAGIAVLAAIVFAIVMFYPNGTAPGPDGSPPPTAPVEVRIGSFFTAIDYAPLVVAKAQGRFEEAFGPAAAVKYLTFESLPTINESLATDRVDIVFEAEPPALVGNAARIDVVMAGVSCSLVQEIIVPESSSVMTVKDLGGKKIGVLAGTSSHYGLLKTLKDAGVEPGAVEVLDMAPPDAKAAFGSGAIDAWAVWPPWVEQETVPGRARSLPGGDAFIHSIMAMRKGFATDHPDLATAAVAVLEETKSWLIANPEKGQEIVANELDLPLDVVRAAWPKHDWSSQIDEAMLADIQAKADFLKDLGLVENRVDVAASFVWHH